MKKLFIYLLFIFCFILNAKAVNRAPKLKRACLNTLDSVVTLSWNPISDICGSYNSTQVFGRFGALPYSNLAQTIDITDNAIAFKIPNLNPDWSFFILINTLCDGITTTYSDTLFLDLQNPSTPLIDSVSIDLLTQKPIIGWKDIADPDRKSFRVYRESGGINSVLGNTTGLSYLVDGQPVNTKRQYALAAVDSCDRVGLISPPVSPIVLSSSFDNCNRNISLSWTPYVGWTSLSYDIFYSLNNTKFIKHSSTTDLVETITIGSFGDNIRVFVRSNNATLPFTSSSNLISIDIPNKELPGTNKILFATVQDKDNIKIVGEYSSRSTDSLVLKVLENNTLRYVDSKKTVPGTQEITWNVYLSTQTKSHSFYIEAYHACDGIMDTSNLARTIYLRPISETLSWNSYSDWEGGVENYGVSQSDGSTWNTLTNTTDTVEEKPSNQEYYCFRIEASSYVVNGRSFNSLSNTQCIDVATTYFLPNAININSPNNTLFLKGQNIDYSETSASVFNRWGQKLFMVNDLKQGYTFTKEDGLLSGIYLYTCRIKSLDNQIINITGQFWIIQ